MEKSQTNGGDIHNIKSHTDSQHAAPQNHASKYKEIQIQTKERQCRQIPKSHKQTAKKPPQNHASNHQKSVVIFYNMLSFDEETGHPVEKGQLLKRLRKLKKGSKKHI